MLLYGQLNELYMGQNPVM